MSIVFSKMMAEHNHAPVVMFCKSISLLLTLVSPIACSTDDWREVIVCIVVVIVVVIV